ncbi:amidohydrolase [Treponema zioleckii]|uniref:amidohydrolase n=1 Tax=Treponema zioleckii TaxID=331680 RepID=UPI00168A72D6|nr:amidohydrolase [Treponema zioleckii]
MADTTFFDTYLEAHRNEYTDMSDKIHGFKELGYQEFKSVALQQDYLRDHGFSIKEKLGGAETAFYAEYGSGAPVIGFLGEYDALSGLGHGCGHHLLGTGGVAAAVALKEWFEEQAKGGKPVQGTIRYYGCPAEENGGGKTFMVRDGFFSDCDIALAWHPSDRNFVSGNGCLANYQVFYDFKGKSAHAAANPESGRSALDGVELMDIGVNYLREHIPETSRIHYAITNSGGGSPNVVQSEAQVFYIIRSRHQRDLKELYERVNNCAQGAALMTGTTVSWKKVAAYADFIYNAPLAELVRDTLLPYESDTTLDPQKTGLGSTDVGDVSWVVPTGYFHVATWTKGTPGHSQSIVDQGKSEKAYKGLLTAAKVLAKAAAHIYEHPEIVAQAKDSLKTALNGEVYDCGLEADLRPGDFSNK